MGAFSKWLLKYVISTTDLTEEAEKRGVCQLTEIIPEAQVYDTINANDILTMLPKTYINPHNQTEYKTRRSFWDTEYKLTSIEEIKRYLKWSQVDKRQYIINTYDCNSFAVSLWGDVREWTVGLAFGLVILPGHAMNWFIDMDRIIWLVEPQSDVVRLPGNDISHYFM